MNDQSFPVTVMVTRPDGSSESVRVGTAVRMGNEFRLQLGELAIGATAEPPPRPRPSSPPPSSGGEPAVFPPYGRSRGAPIAGASVQDLEFYISGSRRSLDDPGKARWHDKERALLAVMEAELARRTAGDAGGAGGASGGGYAPRTQGGYDEPPPYSDDDIPF